jgi:hypothetical protein
MRVITRAVGYTRWNCGSAGRVDASRAGGQGARIRRQASTWPRRRPSWCPFRPRPVATSSSQTGVARTRCKRSGRFSPASGGAACVPHCDSDGARAPSDRELARADSPRRGPGITACRHQWISDSFCTAPASRATAPLRSPVRRTEREAHAEEQCPQRRARRSSLTALLVHFPCQLQLRQLVLVEFAEEPRLGHLPRVHRSAGEGV